MRRVPAGDDVVDLDAGRLRELVEMTSGGILYGTSTVIVWPRMSSLLAAPLEAVAASTTSITIAATATTRRCNLFIIPPCAAPLRGAGGPGPLDDLDGDTTRALDGLQRVGHGGHPLDPLTGDGGRRRGRDRARARRVRLARRAQPLHHDRAASSPQGRDSRLGRRRPAAAARGRDRDPRSRRASARSRPSSRSTPASVATWRERTDIQPMAVVSRADGGRGARARRPASSRRRWRCAASPISRPIQVDAWPAGHFGPAEETGQRLGRAASRSSSRSRATASGPTPSTA